MGWEYHPFKHLIVLLTVSVGEEELESEASEVSSEDMSVVGAKPGDASEEEDIEVVVDKDQKDMREFLQSEEGAKWLQDNPGKKVRTYVHSKLQILLWEQPCFFLPLLSLIVHTQPQLLQYIH